jgi:hypothetical protein
MSKGRGFVVGILSLVWFEARPCFHRYILFTDGARSIRDGINNNRNSHLWAYDNLLGTAESNFQYRFPVNMWCDVVSDQFNWTIHLPASSDRWVTFMLGF